MTPKSPEPDKDTLVNISDHDTNFSPDEVISLSISPPPLSPPSKKPKIVKEKRVSATRTAVEDKEAGKCRGLMRYIDKCTKEELRDQLKKVEGKLDEGWKAAEEYDEMADLHRRMEKREKDRLRQEKHCQKCQEVEIVAGLHTPGGSKRRQQVLFLYFDWAFLLMTIQ